MHEALFLCYLLSFAFLFSSSLEVAFVVEVVEEDFDVEVAPVLLQDVPVPNPAALPGLGEFREAEAIVIIINEEEQEVLIEVDEKGEIKQIKVIGKLKRENRRRGC